MNEELIRLEKTSDNKYLIPDYDELLKKVKEEIEPYRISEVNEDNYKEAKSNKAKLTKLSDEIDTMRKNAEKQYMLPFNQGKAQCKELIDTIKEVTSELDAGIKAIDENASNEKKTEIFHIFKTICNLPIELDAIMDKKWLNKTTKLDDVKKEMQYKITAINYDLMKLKNDLPYEDYKMVAFFYFDNGMDTNKALEKYSNYLQFQEAFKNAL